MHRATLACATAAILLLPMLPGAQGAPAGQATDATAAPEIGLRNPGIHDDAVVALVSTYTDWDRVQEFEHRPPSPRVIVMGPPPGPQVTGLRQWTPGVGVDEVLEMSVDRNQDGDATDAQDDRYHYLYDALGSVVGLLAANGTLWEGYRYDAYGRPTINAPGPNNVIDWGGDDEQPKASSVGNPFLFTGRQWDALADAYHYRARQYDPGWGRFMGRDPIGAWGDASNLGNSYAYVANNPAWKRDPLGLCGGWPNQWLGCRDEAVDLGADALALGADGLTVVGETTVNTVGRGAATAIWWARDSVGVSANEADAALCRGWSSVAFGLAPGLGLGCASADDMRDGNMGNEHHLDYLLAPLDFIPGGRVLDGAATGILIARKGSDALDNAHDAQRLARNGKTAKNGLGAGLGHGPGPGVGAKIPNTGSWANPSTLTKHFRDHGARLGISSEAAYVSRAGDLMRNAGNGRVLGKIDGNFIRPYDPVDDVFGSYTTSGGARSLFRPDPSYHGYGSNMAYWNAQPGVPWP